MSNKYPKLRKNNSCDNWLFTTLGDVTREYKVSNKYVHHQNLLSLSYGKIVKKDIEAKKGLLPASFDTYQIIKEGIIVFRVTDLQNDKKSLRVGISSQEGIITPAYVCVECTTDEISPMYLFTLLHYYDSITKVMYNMGNGLRQTLSYSDLKGLNIPIPPLSEQHFITDIFFHIDSIISEETSRLASLKQVKEASLQAMFPQKGETVPKIRFKGFEGEWVITKAAEIFKTVNERNFSGLPVLSATQDKGMVTRDSIGYNIFHEKSNESTYKHIVPGQFVMHLRSFQGGFAHSAIEGICSPAYTIMEFKDKEKNHDLYWKYVLTSKRFIKSLEMITYGIRDGRTISFDEFKEMVFLVPKVEEQQQIASYFTSLDKQIALQMQRLEKLKQIKAACLDKMFV